VGGGVKSMARRSRKPVMRIGKSTIALPRVWYFVKHKRWCSRGCVTVVRLVLDEGKSI